VTETRATGSLCCGWLIRVRVTTGCRGSSVNRATHTVPAMAMGRWRLEKSRIVRRNQHDPPKKLVEGDSQARPMNPEARPANPQARTRSGKRPDISPGHMFFIITIDTEGDNLWSRPHTVTTENALYLHRFQELCESKGLKPTYLTDYDMARSDRFIEFGRRIVQRDTGEIGMHLHPWNTPPLHPLTDDDNRYHPYLIEYPSALIRDKVALMTELLRDTFNVALRSHRAGRWSFNHVYAQALIEHGYRVDCSVTPHITWESNTGDPRGKGGADYRRFPSHPYFVDRNDIARPGDSELLEVPMSVMPCSWPAINDLRGRFAKGSLPRRVIDRLFPAYSWFRPTRSNLARMRKMLVWARASRLDYIEFMLHSSELMPGGSPTFPAAADIEQLYKDIGTLFEAAAGWTHGATLSEFYEWFRDQSRRDATGDA